MNILVSTRALRRRAQRIWVSLALTTLAPLAHAQPAAALPDLNGDGVADYFMRIAVWSKDTPVVGQFRVFSGADHTLLKGFTSLQIDDGFATTTSSAGDIDGDEIDDVIVGAPLAIADGLPSGKIYIISGADGAILKLITTPPWSYGGMTVAGLGDIDGDGVRDIAYTVRGATGPTDSGFVVVHSVGIDEPVMLLTGVPGDISFGYAIAFLGDTNGDQSPEIAVSAPDVGGVDNARGSVLIFECRDPNGELRVEQTESDARLVIENATLPSCVFGGAMYLGPDIDGDGARELVVGSTIYTQTAEIAVIDAYDLATAALVESYPIDAQKLKSDVNGDLVVDNLDIAAALDLLDLPADPLDPKSGDIDGDGIIGVDDVVSVIQNLDQLAVTPETFSNGQRAEVIHLVTSVLEFSGISPCKGTPPGLAGGVGGIAFPPEGPGEGGDIPTLPTDPVAEACCLYKLQWLDHPPEERPDPPAGCDALGGGGPDDPPRPRPPGWSEDEGGEGSDPPPDCDGMSISGPSFIELGKSATYRVNGNPPGFLMWDVAPVPGALWPLSVSTQPTYLVKGVQVGVGSVFAGVFDDNQDLACADSMTVTVIDCESLTLNAPPQITVGAENYTILLETFDERYSVDWRVENGLEIVHTGFQHVVLRCVRAGVGRVRARLSFQNEPTSCEIVVDIPLVCDTEVTGPDTITDGETVWYGRGLLSSWERASWHATGPIEIVDPDAGNGVTVRGDGCGEAELTLRINDENGHFTGCAVSVPITVRGSGPAQLTLTGLPPDGFLQLGVFEDITTVYLMSTGVGPFTWEIESSVEGAVEIAAQTGNRCTLRISEPTIVDVRVSREFCGEQQQVQASFTAYVIDLAIDSDNDNGWDLPSRTFTEDFIEDQPDAMKLMVVNREDRDNDGIPDYADGYGAFGESSVGGVVGSRFVPIIVDLRGLPPDSQVEFHYSASSPEELLQTVVPVSDIEDAFYQYERAAGLLRLWTRDAFEDRTLTDFIPAGTPQSTDDFQEPRTLYVEAVNGSATPTAITVRVISEGLPLLEDTVWVLPFDSVTGLGVDSIAGVDIHYGTAIGGPGVDIVIGSAGNDAIATGGGNDIIVAGAGDDVIDPGEGEDVIFASHGNDTIGSFSLVAGQNEGEDTYLPETDGQITTAQVLRTYRLLYGDDDPWLEIFLDPEWIGGWVECVAGDGVLFSNSDWDRRKDHAHGGYTYVIQLEFSIGSPFLAATHLRENLLQMASSVWGPTHQFQGAMVFNAWDRALRQDDYDEIITNYFELRQAAFENAAAASALVAGIYVEALTIFSEGTDVIVAISDLTDGNLTVAAAGLFPLLPARLVDDAAEGVLRVVRPGGETLDEFVKRGRVIYGAESGLGFIMRRNMPIEGKMVDGRATLLLGTAQNTGGANGQAHADLVRLLARQRIDEGDVEYATMNRSMRTATGLDNLGSIWNKRPDINAIRRDGKIDLIEVRSDSQTQAGVILSLEEIWMNLPENLRGSRFGVELDGEYFHEIIR